MENDNDIGGQGVENWVILILDVSIIWSKESYYFEKKTEERYKSEL